MDSEIISIQVDAEAASPPLARARTFRSLPEEDRRKLETLLSIRLSEVTQPGESLDAVMQEINGRAKEREPTPEILKSLLNEKQGPVCSRHERPHRPDR